MVMVLRATSAIQTARLTMDNLTAYLQNLVSDLEANTAKAGWFPSAVYPDGTTAAEVALTNEVGDPAHNIPPRPFIRPAIVNHKQQWSDNLGGMIKSGMSGRDALELTAVTMAADIQKAIIDVTTPKLSARTLAARRRRGNNNASPLNDTGYMLSTCIGTVEAKE